MKLRSTLWCGAIFVSIIFSFVPVLADDAQKTSALNQKLQALQKKMQACGSDVNCIQKVTKEMQALTNEYMKSTKNPTGGPGLPNEEREPCAGFPASGTIPSGFSCLSVHVTITNKEEVRQIESYCDPAGVLPCNKKEYVKKSLNYNYTAEAKGELVYRSDFKEFHVNAKGTPSKTRIKQLQGYHDWYTLEGVDAKKKWHHQNFPKASVSIRRPFQFAITYPYGQDTNVNLCFEPMEIESKDESENWLLGTGTSKLCWNHPTIHFIVTPAMMKEIVAKKEFQKIFHWRDSRPGEKSYADNYIDIKLEIGKGKQAPPEKPREPEKIQFIPLAQYKKPPDKQNKNPCDIVKQDLAEVKKIRDAFKDEKLLERAKKEDWDAARYVKEVYQNVFGSSAKTNESPMGTDPTTCKIKINWDKKKYKEKGFPEICYDADLVHEKVHESNCKKKSNPLEYDADMSFPEKLSKEEVSAYNAKIKYLEDWTKKNCK